MCSNDLHHVFQLLTRNPKPQASHETCEAIQEDVHRECWFYQDYWCVVLCILSDPLDARWAGAQTKPKPTGALQDDAEMDSGDDSDASYKPRKTRAVSEEEEDDFDEDDGSGGEEQVRF